MFNNACRFIKLILLIPLCTGVMVAKGQSVTPADVFHLYLVGDAGEPEANNKALKELVRQQQEADGKVPSAIVFLGDNVYPKGMPDEDNRKRLSSEAVLKDQLEIANQIDRVFFIPGNHDWKRGRKHGWEQLQHQQEWFSDLSNPNVFFLPEDGCPGPIEIQLSDKLVIIILDSQWWLHPWEKPEGESSLCANKLPDEIITEVNDILQRNAGKQVVVAAHHPIYTYGVHGGVFTWKDHIFPLSALKKGLYIPLPVIGSIYPLYRKYLGAIQDNVNPVYKIYTEQLNAVLKKYPGTIIASGHEHNLQYIFKDSVHYVVSGSGSKDTPVKQKGYSRFATSALGFVRVSITSNDVSRIDYFVGEDKAAKYSITQSIPSTSNKTTSIIESDTTALVCASTQYKASASHEKWMGKNYRDEWSQKLVIPVFDFTSKGKPLTIVQRGGGMQTLSLRLEDEDGRQYTLRSIEKFPEMAIPEAFRKTFARDIVQDQISASHPYGAIVIPSLAEAAGIYHTNPHVVWLADDDRLKDYRDKFANQLMLLEERPGGNVKDLKFFGSPDDTKSTAKVLKKLAGDNDNYVDESFVLRSRLFDLWIGDWDRHDDQWRWAEFNVKKGKMYRPIPRDRDQAFFLNEGRIPKLLSRKWALPKFEGFDYGVNWPSGLMFNARYFDRSFLSGLNVEEWLKQARELQEALTDKVIEEAIQKWPAEIYAYSGEEIIAKLKARRDKLPDYALDHYRFLSDAVDIVGSDKREHFDARYDSVGNLRVTVSKINKHNKIDKTLYDRTFSTGETKEVRMYGLDGEDIFSVRGDIRSRIRLRIIGGQGEDSLIVQSVRKPWIYDKPNGMMVQPHSRIFDRRSTNPLVNEYNRRAFKYNWLAPLVYFNYNVDDGIFIGGGIARITHGFRKDPFKQSHLLVGSYAINTNSYNFKYDGRFTGVIGRWNVELDADIKSPNFVNNFFGLGNETVFNKNINEDPDIDVDRPIDYYRLRFKEIQVDAFLSRSIGQYAFAKVGPSFQSVELERNDDDRFVKDYEETLSEDILEIIRSFAGVTGILGIDMRNDRKITTRGIYVAYETQWMSELFSKRQTAFQSHSFAMALYHTFSIPARVTLALRMSGGTNTGNYQLYQYQQLDGKTELRGFRKTRFYGDSKIFANNEVRIKLGSIRSHILPGSIGLLTFYDIGRVWYEDENGKDSSSANGKSKRWHQGYGAGFWFAPFDLTIISTEIAHSVEGTLFNIRLGFLF